MLNNKREKFDDTMMIMTSIGLLYFSGFIIKYLLQPSTPQPKRASYAYDISNFLRKYVLALTLQILV